MTGPEHYREAERLLNVMPTHGVHAETGLSREETSAVAQVHATLALVAATAASRYTSPPQEWGGTETHMDDAGGTWAEVLA